MAKIYIEERQIILIWEWIITMIKWKNERVKEKDWKINEYLSS